MVILPATGAPQRYYAPFARFLAARGLRTITFDYRGIGRSRPRSLRGFAATMTEWAVQDAAAAFRLARRLDPDGRVAIVGHSFGGQSVGLIDELASADAAVFFGAQLGYYGHWSGLHRAGLAALWHVGVPVLTAAYGYLPGRFGTGEDLPFGVAREWARWCGAPGYLLDAHPDAAARFAAFRVPSLAISASDDALAPRSAVRALLDQLPARTVTYREVAPEAYGGAPIGHFGFFRERFAGTLWVDAARFVAEAFDGRDQPYAGAPPPRSHPSTPRGDLTMTDVMADLSYGRG